MDGAFWVRASSFAELVKAVAEEVCHRVIAPATVRPGGVRDRVQANASTPEELLCQWLQHYLFLVQDQNMIFCRFHWRTLSLTHIDAEAEGELQDPLRHDLMGPWRGVKLLNPQLQTAADRWEAHLQFTEKQNPL